MRGRPGYGGATVSDEGADGLDYGPDFRYHVWLNGLSYSRPAGWYDFGTFDPTLVNGRLVMGMW